MSKYQDVYPSEPLINSQKLDPLVVSSLLTLEYFEAEPSTMPTQAFEQHHILINLKEEPHRVENWRDGEHRDFTFNKNEIFVTPASISSGWKWHEKSKVIVITLEPKQFENFAINELGVLLSDKQLSDIPQFKDEDLTQAALFLLEALDSKKLGFEVMFESFARVFLVKLIQKYGHSKFDEYEFNQKFTAQHFKRVLDLIKKEWNQSLSLEKLSQEVSISPHHFSRLFKATIGKSPMQFVMTYRLEQSKKLLLKPELTLVDIAQKCGFSDQAHFSRSFKDRYGKSPKLFRN
ncbi:MAG: AraC family transcriptional regulator [Bdellovibrionales bacterium]|nr:AraC family transcriptional regulator [Bdellovibrionales bacterium]